MALCRGFGRSVQLDLASWSNWTTPAATRPPRAPGLADDPAVATLARPRRADPPRRLAAPRRRYASDADLARIDDLTRVIIAGILVGPTARARAAAAVGDTRGTSAAFATSSPSGHPDGVPGGPAPDHLHRGGAPQRPAATPGRRGAAGTYSTVSVPTIPASLWPGTEQ